MVRLSKKHGLNPMIESCFWCGEDKSLVLFGRLPQDQEAPRSGALNLDPCEKCKEHMEAGVILISVDEKKTEDPNNPHRTGGWVVIRDEWVRRAVRPQELQNQILARRVAFLPDDVWDRLGLPRPDKKVLS